MNTPLAAYLRAWPRRFDWGTAHCGHFALGWAQAATGRPALAAIPAVAGLREWVRAVERAGGLQRMVSDGLRCESVPPDEAKPGDLVLLPCDVTGGALGIRLHSGVVVLGQAGGLLVLSHRHAVCAWPLQQVLA